MEQEHHGKSLAGVVPDFFLDELPVLGGGTADAEAVGVFQTSCGSLDSFVSRLRYLTFSPHEHFYVWSK